MNSEKQKNKLGHRMTFTGFCLLTLLIIRISSVVSSSQVDVDSVSNDTALISAGITNIDAVDNEIYVTPDKVLATVSPNKSLRWKRPLSAAMLIRLGKPKASGKADKSQRNGNDFGSRFIEAVLNGTRTAVERFLLTAPDGSSLCNQVSLYLDKRPIANYSLLQVLMIDNQRVHMRFLSTPGFCRMRVVVSGAPMASVFLDAPESLLWTTGTTPLPAPVATPAPVSSNSELKTPSAAALLHHRPTSLPLHQAVYLFNLTSESSEFECELVGDFLGYAKVVIQLQQNATTWHDMYTFRISVVHPQSFANFMLQQSTICTVFIASFIVGLLTDFRLFRVALNKTLFVILLGFVAKLVFMPAICFGILTMLTMEPDLSAAGIYAATFSPIGLEGIFHCFILTSPPNFMIASAIDNHHYSRQQVEFTDATIAAFSGITTAVVVTIILLLSSLGWMPLGGFVSKGIGIPASIILDVGDKFLYVEPSTLPGFDVVPYAAVAIIIGCLILPFSIGTTIRLRWHRLIFRLHRWLVIAVYVCLIYLCVSSWFANLHHVIQYFDWSTILASAIITYVPAVFALLTALCCSQPLPACFALAIVVSCPCTTIAIQLIQANLEPPATDLSVIAPALAAILLQIPLIIAELCKIVRDFVRLHKHKQFSTDSNDAKSPGETSGYLETSSSPVPASLASGGGAESSESQSSDNEEVVRSKSYSTNYYANQDVLYGKRQVVRSTLAPVNKQRTTLRPPLPRYGNKTPSSRLHLKKREGVNECLSSSSSTSSTHNARKYHQAAANDSMSEDNNNEDLTDGLPMPSSRPSKSALRYPANANVDYYGDCPNKSRAKNTLKSSRGGYRESKNFTSSQKLVENYITADTGSKSKAKDGSSSPTVVRFHPLFSSTSQRYFTPSGDILVSAGEIDTISSGFYREKLLLENDGLEFTNDKCSANNDQLNRKQNKRAQVSASSSTTSVLKQRVVHFDDNTGINVENVNDWSKFLTKTSASPAMVHTYAKHATLNTGKSKPPSSSTGMTESASNNSLIPVVLETVV